MNTGDWIICERTSRWVSALRITLAREMVAGVGPRIYEVRHLAALSARLASRPATLVLVEVTRTSLGGVLDWLAERVPHHPSTRFVALLDAEIAALSSQRHFVHDILLEAGAIEIVASPRRLKPILSLGGRQAAIVSAETSDTTEMSIENWAYLQLPWQSN